MSASPGQHCGLGAPEMYLASIAAEIGPRGSLRRTRWDKAGSGSRLPLNCAYNRQLCSFWAEGEAKRAEDRSWSIVPNSDASSGKDYNVGH